MPLQQLEFLHDNRRWRADLTRPASIAIALDFTGLQPSFFGAPAARAEPLKSGGFVGDVSAGGSCQCSTYTLTPHCNGTHTESVGHVVREPVSIHAIATDSFALARLISVEPVAAAASTETSIPPAGPDDRWISAAQIDGALAGVRESGVEALIIRTLPNAEAKKARDYSAGHDAPPYFSLEAMRSLVARGYTHLVVDLPSVDRAEDGGNLSGHRIFWGLPPGSVSLAEAKRARATITELAYIGNDIMDGLYLLNLQLAAFASDAAPSRPVLYPLELINS